MKSVNAAYRRGGWDAVPAKRLLTEEQIAEVQHTMRFVPGGTDKPFPSFVFSNAAGEIGRIKKRVAELQEGPPQLAPIEGEGWRIEARADLNRVAISFDAKPPAEISGTLKRGGWRWTPRAGAWLRMLNKATLWAIDDALTFLPAKASSPPDGPPPLIYRETVPTRASRRARHSKPKRAATNAASMKLKGATKGATATKLKPAANPKRGGGLRKASTMAKAQAKCAKGADGPAFACLVTHRTTRARLDARDYGHKAWPLQGSER